MSVLNFLLKNLQGCCLLFNYQGSFSLLSSQRQLIYIITFTIACQQLFYFSFSLSASIISVVRNSLSRISFLSTFVNRKFHFFLCFFLSRPEASPPGLPQQDRQGKGYSGRRQSRPVEGALHQAPEEQDNCRNPQQPGQNSHDDGKGDAKQQQGY